MDSVVNQLLTPDDPVLLLATPTPSVSGEVSLPRLPEESSTRNPREPLEVSFLYFQNALMTSAKRSSPSPISGPSNVNILAKDVNGDPKGYFWHTANGLYVTLSSVLPFLRPAAG